LSLASLLFDVARRQPEMPAVTDGGTTWSYAQFAARIGAIGGGLHAAGLAPGDRVVLWMENCAEFLESLFACWAAGICAVPVNAKLHPREVAHIVGDSGARLTITTPGLAALAGIMQDLAPCRVVCAATDEYRRLAATAAIAPVASAPTDLAWIFYTSGTTGRPKGAMLSHRNLLAMSICYLADIDTLGPQDVKLHMAPLSHGTGLYALPFFLKGAHHVVLPGFDVDDIAATLARYDRVSMFAAPTMLTRLVNSDAVHRIDPRRLKTIYYGGGPMYVADLKRALELLGPRLYQIFGQGESPMTISGLAQSLHLDADGRPIEANIASCGVARTGISMRVVDDAGHDLPVGEIGEVVTQSDCVMAGYWGNLTSSAAALRDGWLFTGDVGSLDARGFLTLRDRSKDMIISGGSNIYPREVEEVLLRHPGVAEVSVVSRRHADWGEEVVAFVVARPGEDVVEAELDRLCLDHIARFKRPKQYRYVETLPKNNYGKVLKTELRRMLEGESVS
jgi:acyl-CoA synthetase (AMP-forming)/AMP-acid ligase II